MRRGVKNTLKIALIFGAIFFALKGLSVRKVVWEGGAPVSFGKVAKINEHLLGRPIWLISEGHVRRWLKGEMVGKLELKRKLPWTIIVIAEPPYLVGAIPSGSKATLVDLNGHKRAEVPLFATRLPFLMLPDNVSVQKCMVAVRRILELSAQQGFDVRAIWVSHFGEVAIYLPEGFWLKLGNPTALELKMKLGKALYQNKLLSPQMVADLSLPKVISVWGLEQRRR